MTDSVIPPSQYSSAEFFQNAKIQGDVELAFCDNVWQQVGCSASLDRRVVICAEALTLDKVARVLKDIAPHIDTGIGRVLSELTGLFGSAIAFRVEAFNEASVQEVIEEVANRYQVEIALLSDSPCLASPGLLLMDMDSTVINVECIDEIAELAGVGEHVAAVTEAAMQGHLDFSESLIQRVRCLEGAPVSILEQVRHSLPLMPGIERLVHVLKSYGWKVAIASGGFTFFADYLMKRLNLDAAIANRLLVQDEKLAGTVDGEIVDANVKADTLISLATQYDIPMSQTVAVGDGANDLAMMAKASLGVAYHAKPIVRKKADSAIRFAGLDTLLWLLHQG